MRGIRCTVSAVRYMAYGVRCTVHGGRCAVRGARYIVYGVRCMVCVLRWTVYGVRCAVHGIRYAVHVVWCMMCGVRCTVHGVRYTVYGVRCTVCGVRCVVHGIRQASRSALPRKSCGRFGVYCVSYTLSGSVARGVNSPLWNVESHIESIRTSQRIVCTACAMRLENEPQIGFRFRSCGPRKSGSRASAQIQGWSPFFDPKIANF